MILNTFKLVVKRLWNITTYKTTKRGRENDLILLKPIKKEFKKVIDSDVPIKEKRRILSEPQVGRGIFTLLASTILPALFSFLQMK